MDPLAHGGQFSPDGNSDPDVLYLFRWDSVTPKDDAAFYVQPGDWVVLFDTGNSYPEGAFETAVVVSTEFADIPKNPTQCFPPNCGEMSCECVSVLKATLDSDLSGSYQSSPLDFSSGRSAAVGVISGCDASPNQLNGPGSAFYDADMRDIEQPFDDAYVEFVGLRSGMGAVPYVHWTTDATADQLISFSNLWWSTANRGAPNYLHLLGIEGATPSNPNQVGGSPYRTAGGPQSGASYIYVGRIEQNHPDDPVVQRTVNQYCAVHELTHNFSVNGYTAQTYHCSEAASSPPEDSHGCIMHAAFVTYLGSNPRFCVPHVLTGGGALTDVHVSVRMQQDPLPY